MKHPFDNSRISNSVIKEFPFTCIFETTSETGYLTDEEGNPHAVSISKSVPLSFDDGIPKDIDADSLSMENCLKNNYNLQEVNGYTSSTESPEDVTSYVEFDKLNSVLNKPQEEPVSTTPSTSDPITQPNN